MQNTLPVRHIENIPVILLQVNYSNRIAFYALTETQWNQYQNSQIKKLGFICIWKLRKLKPFGPKPPHPLSFLINPVNEGRVRNILYDTDFTKEEFTTLEGRAWTRVILKQYSIRQIADLFQKLGRKGISTDIL